MPREVISICVCATPSAENGYTLCTVNLSAPDRMRSYSQVVYSSNSSRVVMTLFKVGRVSLSALGDRRSGESGSGGPYSLAFPSLSKKLCDWR